MQSWRDNRVGSSATQSSAPSPAQWKANSWKLPKARRSQLQPRQLSDGKEKTAANSEHEVFQLKLLELFKNFNQEFFFDENVKPWDNDRLWSIIAREMSNESKQYSAKQCKNEFSSLYARYFFIIKQRNYAKAYKFAVFEKLHQLDLSVFDKDIDAAKEEFDNLNPQTKLKKIETDILKRTDPSFSLEDSNSAHSDYSDMRTFRYEEVEEANFQARFEKSAQPSSSTSLPALNYGPPMRLERRDPMVDDSKYGKTFRAKFFVHDIEQKELLVLAVYKYNNQFLNYAAEDIFDVDEPWSLVMMELRSKIKDYSEIHCKFHFQNLIYQYKHIIERLPHWTREKALKFWPFFRTFHARLNLRCFIFRIDELKDFYDKYDKNDGNEDFDSLLLPDGQIPKNFFYVHYVADREKLLRSVIKYGEEFVTAAKCENVWEIDQVWKFVNKDMADVIEKCNIRRCKFNLLALLDQYVAIVRDLPTVPVEEARKIFALFDIMHNEMNLTPFCPSIREHRKRYTEYQADKAPSSSGSKPQARKPISIIAAAAAPPRAPAPAPEPKPVAEVFHEGDDEADEDVELVLSVREHLNEFRDFSIADDDIWLRIALDMDKFEKQVYEKGRYKWKARFEDMMRKYYKMSAEFGEEVANQKWVLFNQFSTLNLNPFLDRMQNPVKETKIKTESNKRMKTEK